MNKTKELKDILADLNKTLKELNSFINDKETENESILKELRNICPAREIDMLRNKYYDNSDDISDATQVYSNIKEILGGNYES